MAEKVLPAKGAKALLEAVGFAQAPGHAVLVMQGRDVAAAPASVTWEEEDLLLDRHR